MPKTQPIEDQPELRSFLRNTAEWSITILMWALWVYFFLPLLSLILWGVGMAHLYRTLFSEEIIGELIIMMGKVGWLVLIVFILLKGWGFYNYRRFGQLKRRKVRAVTPTDEIGHHFDLTVEEVRKLKNEKEIVWHEVYDDIQKRVNANEDHYSSRRYPIDRSNNPITNLRADHYSSSPGR